MGDESSPDVTNRSDPIAAADDSRDRQSVDEHRENIDLLNPLTVAKGRVDFLREEDDNEHLEATARANERMEVLIEDVLALAQQGKSIAELEEITLSVVARDAWDVIESDAVTLTVESDGSLLADSTRLQQLLENLFRNAIEHGGEDVEISVGVLDDNTGFFVADNGTGIPIEDREAVLESGFSTSSDGTGLGLAIVTEIVAAHDWQIRVTNSAEDGARFEITDGKLED